MPVYCTYHPLHYAAFSCPKCHANLCPSCIVKKKNEFYGYSKDVYLCPKCTVFVDKLSFAHAIEPFWKRLPAIFQYPLHLQPIALIIALAFIQTFFASKTLTGLIVQILCFGIILTYACLALAASANGRLHPPPIEPSAISKNFNLFFKQLALYVILAIVVYQLASTLLPYLGIEPTLILASVFGLITMLLLPAMIIMLAVTKSLVAAIAPHAFILLAWRIGWPYLALCFFLSILISAPAMLAGLIWNHLPREVGYFLAMVFSSYYMIVSYHLMGYMLFQYHEKAGYQVDYEGDFHSSVHKQNASKNAQSGNQADDLLNRINVLIRDGNYDAAVSEIQQSTHGVITDPALADRYYNLLYLRKMKADLLAFAPDYIKLMYKTNDKEKICAAYLFCSPLRPDFLDDHPSLLFAVGKTLLESNYAMDALKVFDHFVQIHQDHSMTPNSYFFIARIFNEKLNNPVRAAKIIQWLMKNHPFHENASFVQAYAKQIKG